MLYNILLVSAIYQHESAPTGKKNQEEMVKKKKRSRLAKERCPLPLGGEQQGWEQAVGSRRRSAF